MNKPDRLLGVLGGMGPLATVDFLQKLIEETPASRDQDHVPVVVYSVPQIPDRPGAIIGNSESPLPHMLEGVLTLKRAGATAIAIACNTAHFWFDALSTQGGVPILHIADAACAALAANVKRVGLIATDGTLAAGFYQQRLALLGKECLRCTPTVQRQWVLPAIERVKRTELAHAHALAIEAAQHLLERGAQAIIMGCTEIPLAIEQKKTAVSAHCVDATRALARECVQWWQNTAPSSVVPPAR